MSQLIEQSFKNIGEGRYVYHKRQIAYAIVGCFGFIILLWAFFFSGIINLFTIFAGTIFCGGSFLIIAMGLYTVTSEINLSTRKVRITRRTIWGYRTLWGTPTPVNELPLDQIHIGARRMGVTDANPHDVWIVTAGFIGETEDYDRYNIAIFSHETENIDERNRVMLELYHFFFPDRQNVGLDKFVTTGNIVEILTDAKKNDLTNSPALFEKKG